MKTWVEPGPRDSQTEISVFLFVPKSFQVGRWAKADLEKDLFSRARLAMPSVSEEPGKGLTAAAVLEKALRALKSATESPEDQATEHCQNLGSIVSEWLKLRGADHRRRFRMAHSLFIPVEQRGLELRRLLVEVARTVELLQTLRSALEKQMSQAPVTLHLLDEYLSNFYVKYLGKLRTAMEQTDPQSKEKADGEVYRAIWAEFEGALAGFQRAEADYRTRFPRRVEIAATPFEQEQAVVRLGQLKKFFQSRMFMEVSRHSPATRFLETTAIIGTAIAGVIFALLQLWSQSAAASAGSGAFFFGFAILAYVARDRIKDRAKHSLHKRLQQWLPDTNQQLKAEGRLVGGMREWFSVGAPVPDGVKALRKRAALDALEPTLPEDVLTLRKELNLQSHSGAEPFWALQESTRINLERYLKFMDDPMKEIAVLDADGELKRRASRRVYHFYLATEITQLRSDGQTARSTRQLHRVVLDKRGIDRLEAL
ncbi:hypothetical protein K2X33_03350 [bacterium]|nr:hypothetical protein [bacterium]